MESLFCPECHNLLDLPGDEDVVTCTVCGAKQSSSVFENRPVVTRSRPGLFGDIFRKKVVSGQAGKTHNDGAMVRGCGWDLIKPCRLKKSVQSVVIQR